MLDCICLKGYRGVPGECNNGECNNGECNNGECDDPAASGALP